VCLLAVCDWYGVVITISDAARLEAEQKRSAYKQQATAQAVAAKLRQQEAQKLAREQREEKINETKMAVQRAKGQSVWQQHCRRQQTQQHMQQAQQLAAARRDMHHRLQQERDDARTFFQQLNQVNHLQMTVRAARMLLLFGYHAASYQFKFKPH